MDADDVASDIGDAIDQWCPRAVLRPANWLYMDALYPRDIREMSVLINLIYLCQSHAQQFIV